MQLNGNEGEEELQPGLIFYSSVEAYLGRPRRRWEDNIRMNLEEIGINAGN